MRNLKHYLAHVRRNEDGSFEIHGLEDHLRAVGDLANEFASTFGYAAFGYADWGHSQGSGMTWESFPRPSKALSPAGMR
ncbi:MAG: hypothetical protein L0H94_04885 [Nitrospira sp.]|nr:hypothetical protein [Nitrospira sp.]